MVEIRSGDAEFSVTHPEPPTDTLLCGFTNYGLAGLTAVDFLIDQLELETTGYITTAGLPSITPFEAGKPTHHTQLFSQEELEVTLLKSELFIPPVLGKPLGDEILDWTEKRGVEDVAVLEGIRYRHGPEEHQTYYVATEDYRKNRLADVDVTPMGRGFLDGVNGALVERGIGSSLGVGVFITPVHDQMPDVEAAIRLVETVNEVYDLGVDTGPLQEFAAEVARYYTDLAERYREESQKTDTFADRMYM